MCGIVGIAGTGPVAHRLFDAMTILQHRGQDAAGIATLEDDRMYLHRGNGLANDVFRQSDIDTLIGNIGIGHVRYPTAGSDRPDEAQPLYVNSPYGLALGHNGNLVNSAALREQLFMLERRHLNTGSDSEVLLNILAHELAAQNPAQPIHKQLFNSVDSVHQRCRGAYAVTVLVVGQGLLAFRDPLGIRPLVLGVRCSTAGDEYMVASESVALDGLGFSFLRDVAPGESIFIDHQGNLHSHVSEHAGGLTQCMFELVYFARPDSLMDDISVYKARLRMGEILTQNILRQFPDHDIDVVIPIPDTSRTAALPMAHELGVKYREGFIKNRYIGRTFIMPGQAMRDRSVRRKLNPIALEFRHKNVLLVDDSIVRGTTSRQIIEMAREAGARKVYMASASPPVRFPNVYGIDMPAAEELIAHGRSVDEICTLIGADRLFYQDLDDLRYACLGKKPAHDFDTSCFDGNYATGLDDGYLEALSRQRSDSARQDRSSRLRSA